MLYELRSYDIDPERIDGYLAWANSTAMPILMGQFGFRVKGFWHAIETSEGPAPETNVHWLIAWESEDEMKERWAIARASEEWKAAMAETMDPDQPNGRKYHRIVRSKLLAPIPASPLQ